MQDDDDNWVRIGLIGTYQGEYRVGSLTVNVNSICIFDNEAPAILSTPPIQRGIACTGCIPYQ